MPHPKETLYQHLFTKMNNANKNSFYFETIWIAYSMIEDRINSVLNKTGGNRDRMISKKMELLEKRKNVFVKAQFPKEFIRKISQWVDRRNKLSHEMANANKPIEYLDKKAALLALEAPGLVNEISGAVTRVKKSLKKKSIIQKTAT